MEWINVDERLPEVYEEATPIKSWTDESVDHYEYHKVSALVLVAGKDEDGEVFVSDDVLVDNHWANHSDFSVTHWMPLPEPPEVE